MGLHDIENIFSNDQVITVTANSTNVIDLGDDSRGLGYGLAGKDNVFATSRVSVEDFTAGGSATLVLTLLTDSDVAFGSAVTLFTSATIAVADLVLGYQAAQVFLPSYSALLERYLRWTYTVATGPMTAGALFTSIDQAGFATNV